MPFGIASTFEVFQKDNLDLFDDIECVEIYFDDIIIPSCDEHEHDLTLKKVLQSAKKCNIKCNS